MEMSPPYQNYVGVLSAFCTCVIVVARWLCCGLSKFVCTGVRAFPSMYKSANLQ